MYVDINKAGKDRAVIEFIKKSGISPTEYPSAESAAFIIAIFSFESEKSMLAPFLYK